MSGTNSSICNCNNIILKYLENKKVNGAISSHRALMTGSLKNFVFHGF